jgi:ribose transport system ATP-binding protein
VVASHISKAFGGVRALDDVSFTVVPGEVHGLLGENGSGKSTLVKVLAGYHDPEPGGSLQVRGVDVKLPLKPGQFRALGMGFVHQDLALVPSLTVLENLRVSAIASSKQWWHISWESERRQARASLAKFDVELDLDVKVATLRPVDRARLAIVRAVEDASHGRDDAHLGGEIVFLDEPTAFLPGRETHELFALIREITGRGGTVVFISHDLDEVREITDRVTVLRDGKVKGTGSTSAMTHEELIEMIIGHTLAALEARHSEATAAPIGVSIEALAGGSLSHASFDIHQGEVLGVTGLLGSGSEEIPYRLFGALKSSSGRVVIQGRSYDLSTMTPHRALQAGMALLPGDRQNDGSVGSLTVGENVTLQVLARYFKGLRLRLARMLHDSKTLLGLFDVRPNDPAMKYQQLSGGNQQKVLLAKWFQTNPQFLLLHEPTRGVDVGARRQIFALIHDAAGKGACILCATSDYEEAAALCDRLLVLRRGKVIQELRGDAITKERVFEQSTGGSTSESSGG